MVVSRSLPLLLQRHLYSCQAFVESFKLEITTCYLRNALLAGVSVGLSLMALRIGIVFRRVASLKKYRVASNHVRHLGALLKKLDLEQQVSLIASAEPFAFCFGLSQPHIYLSTSLVKQMSQPELEAILLHEKYHADHHDSLTLFIASLMLMAFPFFPVLANLIGTYRLRAELQADQAAITAQASKKYLLSVLRKMLEVQVQSPFAAAALADHTLEARIQYLVAGHHRQEQIPLASLSFSLSSVILLLAIVFIPTSTVQLEWQPQNTEVCIGGKSCAIKCSATSTLPMSIVEPLSSQK